MKLNAAAHGPIAAKLTAPSFATYAVSTRERHGSINTAPRVGSARAKISESKTWRLEAPTTAELSFRFARTRRLARGGGLRQGEKAKMLMRTNEERTLW